MFHFNTFGNMPHEFIDISFIDQQASLNLLKSRQTPTSRMQPCTMGTATEIFYEGNTMSGIPTCFNCQELPSVNIMPFSICGLNKLGCHLCFGNSHKR